MRNIIQRVTLALLLVAASATYVRGFAFLYMQTPGAAYRVQSPGNVTYRISSTFLGGSAANIQAARDAFTTWDLLNTSINFSQVGSSERVYVYSEYQGSGGPLAYTQTSISGQTITHASINVNTYYSWSANPSYYCSLSGPYDIHRVIMHEAGHAIGLDHPNQADGQGKNYNKYLQTVAATGQEVMNSAVSCGPKSPNLNQDDLDGRDYLYPYTPADSTAPAVVSNLTVIGVDLDAIQLQWTASGDDGNTGKASSYSLRYSTSPITSNNFSNAVSVSGVPAPKTAGSTEIFTVTGLTQGTTYYFAIKSSDEVGNTSGISNTPNETTLVDSDGDGLSDMDEIYLYFTDPYNPDTDGDTFTDGLEVGAQTDPLDPGDVPAVITLTADNSFSLYVKGVLVGSGSVWNQPKVFYVNMQVGDDVAVLASNSGGAAGLACQVRKGDIQVTSFTWQVSTSASNGWTLGNYDHSAWPGAREIAVMGQGVWGTQVSAYFNSATRWIWSNSNANLTCYFYTRFNPDVNGIIKATADNSFVLYHNGVQVLYGGAWSQVKFAPVHIDIDDTLAMWCHDAGVGIGSCIGEVTYRNGGTDYSVVTDGTWKVFSGGPPTTGWEQPGFDDSIWAFASVVTALGGAPWYTSGTLGYIKNTAKWIWASDSYNINDVWIRKVIPNPPNATLNITGDNTCMIRLNGTQVGQVKAWNAPQSIGLFIQSGDVIGIDGTDFGGIGGVIFSLNYGGSTSVSNSTVKVFNYTGSSLPSDWADQGYDDAGWSNASSIGVNGVAPWGRISSVASNAKWIWSGDAYNHNNVAMRYVVGSNNTPQGETTAKAAADNTFILYVNGAQVASGSNWQSSSTTNLILNPGDVIAAKATDSGFKAGFLFGSSGAYNIVSDGTWKVYAGASPPAGWNLPGFDISSWPNATEYGAYGVSPWGTGISGWNYPAARWIWSNRNPTGGTSSTIDPVVYFVKVVQ